MIITVKVGSIARSFIAKNKPIGHGLSHIDMKTVLERIGKKTENFKWIQNEFKMNSR